MAGINVTSCKNGKIENNIIYGELKISNDSKVKVKKNRFFPKKQKRK